MSVAKAEHPCKASSRVSSNSVAPACMHALLLDFGGLSDQNSNEGLQAFSAENLLCTLEPLILLSFYHRVIKKGVGNPLCFGVENRGFFLVPEVIIYESLCDHRDE